MTPPAELFPASEVASESPRLRWIREHGLRCAFANYTDAEREEMEAGDSLCPPWSCYHPDQMPGEGEHGSTADEACANYAAAHGLKLWNESL